MEEEYRGSYWEGGLRYIGLKSKSSILNENRHRNHNDKEKRSRAHGGVIQR